MKKRKRFLIFFLIGAILSGCQKKEDERSAWKEKTRILYFSREKNLYQENNVWAQIAQGLTEEARKHDNLLLSIYEQEDSNRINYAEQIEMAISMDTDILIAHGAIGEKVKNGYEQLKEAGIELVLLDGDVPESGRILYVGTDNVEEGRRAASLALEIIEGEIFVGILDEQRDVQNEPVASLSDRQEGFEEVVAQSERIKILAKETGLNSLLKVTEATEQMLENYPQINLLFCTDSITGQAAASVIKEKNLTGKVHIICFDMTQEIKKKIEEGVIDFTMVQQTEECGRICMEELSRRTKNTETKEIYLECKIVTKENIAEYE